MKKLYCFALVILPFFANALEVDIISSFNIEELPAKLEIVKRVYDVKSICPTDYFVKRSPYDSNLVKIIVFDPFFNREVIPKLPKEKLVLFIWEPQNFPLEFYDTYSKVYTWDDSLVDNIKFFRFNYPYLMPFNGNSLRFEEKKLCTLVVGNWTQQRLNILKFFEANQPEGLDCYGRRPPELENTSMWKGAISGLHSGNEKISTLQNYRFCVCFENTIGSHGYITEKIFSCFAAGCVPIYWGAANISDYIPKTCFIDYRDFRDNEALYKFISTMSQEVYQEYVEEIAKYLKSQQALLFSPQFFDNLIYEAITH